MSNKMKAHGLKYILKDGTKAVSVTTVIGEKKPHQNWYQSLAGLHGRYGIAHVKDYYGLGQQSYADFFSNPTAS